LSAEPAAEEGCYGIDGEVDGDHVEDGSAPRSLLFFLARLFGGHLMSMEEGVVVGWLRALHQLYFS
jgi:hypothetical protein